MKNKNCSFSGQLGLVLLTDHKTNVAIAQAAKPYQKGSSINLSKKHTPHVSLYHSKLKNIPLEVIDLRLERIHSRLPADLEFSMITAFGRKFIFWNIEPTAELQALHYIALDLSHYFNPSGQQQADKEKIILSPIHLAHVKKFAHPLVRDLWQPHAALGYYPKDERLGSVPLHLSGRANHVAFARIGQAGTIKEILIKK
jgi:hypothetical protein